MESAFTRRSSIERPHAIDDNGLTKVTESTGSWHAHTTSPSTAMTPVGLAMTRYYPAADRSIARRCTDIGDGRRVQHACEPMGAAQRGAFQNCVAAATIAWPTEPRGPIKVESVRSPL